MKHFIKTAFLLFGMLTITYSCQKEDETIQEQNRYNVPSIEKAQLYFNERIDLSSFGSNQHFRTLNNALSTDWNNSKAKTYKDQPQENFDILYTPIYLPTSGHAKSFVGSLEINGEMHSKIFVLLYTESDNRLAFSGIMLIYGLNGQIEYSYRYEEGQQVASGLPNLTNTSLNRTGENGEDDGCDFPLDCIGGLMDWLGTDWFGVLGYLENDTVELTAGDSSTNGFIVDPDLGPSINIPALGDPAPGSGTATGTPWWPSNTVDANGLSIAMALELEHLVLPEAEWLLNEASTEQLQAIASFLNDNRTINKDTTPDGFDDNTVDQNQMTEISQEAINLALFVINTMIDNPNMSFDFLDQNEISNPSDYINFDTPDEFTAFIDALNNPNFTSETTEDPDNPERVVTNFKAELSIFADMNLYITQHLADENHNYEVIDVTSAMSGFTLGLVWTQDAWDYNANQYVSTVNIYGHVDAILFIEGLGTVFSENKHYEANIHVTNGNGISAELIND